MSFRQVSRLLVVSQNWMGDVLFSSPAIRAIKRHNPNIYLACLAPQRVSEVLRHNPYVNEVLVYDERASLLSLVGPFHVWRAIRKKHFDGALFFHRSRSKAFLTALEGIPVRVGFARAGKSRFLTQAVEEPSEPMHRIDYFLHLLQEAGIPSDGRWVDFEVRQEEDTAANKMLLKEGIGSQDPFVTVHPGGNWDLKRWRAEFFVKWIRLFSARTGWKVVLCGGPGLETQLSQEIMAQCADPNVISLCGKTSLGELAALLKRAKFLLSNDSGPIHIAASQKTRILGLYGPTSPEWTGPVSQNDVRILWKDVGCSVPCYFKSCDHRVCLDFLSPEEVFEKSLEWTAS